MPYKTKEKKREHERLYYQEHRKEASEAKARWREKNPELVKKHNRKAYQNRRLKAEKRRQKEFEKRGARCEHCPFSIVPEVIEMHSPNGHETHNEWLNINFDWSKILFLCPTCHAIEHLKDGKLNPSLQKSSF